MDARATQLIIRGDGHIVLHWVGRDGHIERILVHVGIFGRVKQDVGVVAVGHQFTGNLNIGVAGILAVGAVVLPINAVRIVGMALVDIVGGKLVSHLGTAIGKIVIEAVAPHQTYATRAPATTVVYPSAILRLATRRIGTTGAPEMLRVSHSAVDLDVVCGLVEFGGIACVVVAVGATAPVMTRGDKTQLCFFDARIKFEMACWYGAKVGIVAETVVAKPQFAHVDIGVFGRTLGVIKGDDGVVAVARPDIEMQFKLNETLQQGGEVADIEVVVAFLAKRCDIAEELDPLATVVLHAAVANTVV